MRSVRYNSILAVAAIVVLCLPCSAMAQETLELKRLRDEPHTPQFEQDITVRLHLIDVTAIDSAGNYVTDLKAEDFTVFVNGREMQIRTFDAYFPGAIVAESEESGIPVAATPARLLVLFFDQAYSSYRGLREAKDAAEEFVERNLSPGDQVMIVGYDQSLKIHQNFTRDRDAMVEAIQNIRYGFSLPEGGDPNYFRAENQYNVRIYLQALKKLALYLKSFRGRKTIIMLSEGFDQRIALAYLPQYQKELLESFNDSNCTVFSLDVYGLDAGAVSIRRRQERHNTLSVFANETGGTFYRGSNNISDLLLGIDSDISHYYVLGFYMDEEYDGSFRDVAVTTKKPGVKLLYRKGFFALKKFDKLSKDEKNIQFLEGFNRNSPFTEFEAVIGAHVYPRDDGSAVATVIVEAPLTSGSSPQFELLGYVYSKEAELIDAFHKSFEFSASPVGDTFRHVEVVKLEPGSNVIKVGLRNNSTGERAYNFIEARMPELGSGQYISTVALQASPQKFLLSSKAKVRLIKELLDVPHTELADPLAPLSRMEVFASPVIECDRATDVGVIYRVVGIDMGESGPRLVTKYSLRSSGGQAYQVEERNLQVFPVAGSNAAIVYSTLDLSKLPAGEYLLRVAVEDTIAERVIGQQATVVLR